MSKQVELEANCLKCGCTFKASLFRSIWGEHAKNREIVFNDTINVMVCPHCRTRIRAPLSASPPPRLPVCPHCRTRIRAPFSLLYVDMNRQFAVWYEPERDPMIDQDTRGYAAMFGAECFYVTAPRTSDWEAFKHTILQFERGELRAKPISSTKARTATQGKTGEVKDCASCGRSVRTVYGDLTSGNLICAPCWKAFYNMLGVDAAFILVPGWSRWTRRKEGGAAIVAAAEALFSAGCGAMMAWKMVAQAETAEAQSQEAAGAVAKALAANAALLAKGKVLAKALDGQPEDVVGTVARVMALVTALEAQPALRAATVAAAVKSMAQMEELQAEVEALQAKKALESLKVVENKARADPSRTKKDTSDRHGEMGQRQSAGGAGIARRAGVAGLVGAAIGGLVGGLAGGLVGAAIGGLVVGFACANIALTISVHGEGR